MYYHFRSIPISFNSRVTWAHKATTVANDTSICSTILVLFLAFHFSGPGWNFPYKKAKTKFIPATEPARKPLTIFSLYFLVLLFDRSILGENQEYKTKHLKDWLTSLPFISSVLHALFALFSLSRALKNSEAVNSLRLPNSHAETLKRQCAVDSVSW